MSTHTADEIASCQKPLNCFIINGEWRQREAGTQGKVTFLCELFCSSGREEVAGVGFWRGVQRDR